MKKFKVLIADDIEIIAQTNKKIAEKNESIEVIGLAYNGQQEYDMILELKPDIVITDNQMPNMNGVEVVKKIYNSNLASVPKFILVTADYGYDFNNKCMQMGISIVVNKNSREIDLPSAISEIIDELEMETTTAHFEPSEEYKKWHEKYSTEELVDLKKYFNDEDFEILRKLGISIKDKIYTEREFEELDGDYILYYYEDGMEEGMSKEEKEGIKSLENTGVSREEYNRLLDKFHKINLEFNF